MDLINIGSDEKMHELSVIEDLCVNENVDQTIELLRSTPALVTFVPKNLLNYDMYLICVIQPERKHLSVSFSDDAIIDYSRRLVREESKAIFSRIDSAESASTLLEYYTSRNVTTVEERFYLLTAKGSLLEYGPHASAECVDSVKRAVNFRDLFGLKTAMDLLKPKYKRAILDNDLSL